MAIPHNCIGSPCLICFPNQRVVGTTPDVVIDCNLARKIADPRDAELARLRAEVDRLIRDRDRAYESLERETTAHAASRVALRAALAEVARLTERGDDLCARIATAEARVRALEAGIGDVLRDGIPCYVHVRVRAGDPDECRGCRARKELRALLAPPAETAHRVLSAEDVAALRAALGPRAEEVLAWIGADVGPPAEPAKCATCGGEGRKVVPCPEGRRDCLVAHYSAEPCPACRTVTP